MELSLDSFFDRRLFQLFAMIDATLLSNERQYNCEVSWRKIFRGYVRTRDKVSGVRVNYPRTTPLHASLWQTMGKAAWPRQRSKNPDNQHSQSKEVGKK